MKAEKTTVTPFAQTYGVCDETVRRLDPILKPERLGDAHGIRLYGPAQHRRMQGYLAANSRARK